MNTIRTLITFVALILAGQMAFAQDLSRYRAYTLESTLAQTAVTSGARAVDAKTLHSRPATIQELEWRAPYADFRNARVDPVRHISFTFYNDALYQLIVSYDRTRTEGLTSSDIVESLATEYGPPTLPSARPGTGSPVAPYPDSVVLARWEGADSLLTLVRGSYSAEYQLILVSKALSARARTAVGEAVRLDAVDAPRREAAERERIASAADEARDKARLLNKEAFRP